MECERYISFATANTQVLQLEMFVPGTLRTSIPTLNMRALGGEGDIPDARSGVR